MNLSSSETTAILQLVGSFYDAAAKAESWEAAIANLSDVFDIYGTILEQHDIEGGSLLEFESVGLPADAIKEWAEHYHAICPRLEFLKRHPAGTIGFDHKILEPTEIKRHPLYQDFLRPYGTGYFLSATLEHDAERYTTVAMQRSIKQGHVSARDIAVLELLVKPMRQAFQLKKFLRLNDQKLKDYESAFHSLKTGIVILDGKGRVEFVNYCADQIASNNEQISIRGGYFSFAARDANQALNKALQQLSAASTCGDADSISLSSRTNGSLPLRIDMLPLPKEAQFSYGLRGCQFVGRRLMMFLSDPNRQKEPPEKLLNAFFGLTPTETRLALGLAHGETLRQFAERHEVAMTTVRTHLASLRNKMGATRQADVVRLVTQLVQPLLD